MKRMLDQKLIDFLNSLGDSLKYESSTNTFEIGTNLYVDGDTTIQGDFKTYGNLESFNDSFLSFYQGNTAQYPYMSLSPLFDDINLIFEYNDGQDITNQIILDMSKDANILTDKNTKTIFGNQSIYGSGNIDLYRHQIALNTSIGTYWVEIISSNNLKVDSVTDLTTLTKATNGYKIVAYKLEGADSAPSEMLFNYASGVWSGSSASATILGCTDSITTI